MNKNIPESSSQEPVKKRIEWSDTLIKYETPTVFKEELLKPYFEKVELREPILDVGCGKGYFDSLLTKKGYKLKGIDLNSQLESNDHFEFSKVDFIDYETSEKFETILLINILTTASPEGRLQILKKIKEIKSETGIAYVINTNAELFGTEIDSETLTIKNLEEGKFRLKVKLVSGEFIEFDDYIVTKNEMVKLCEEAGLEIVEMESLESSQQAKPVYDLYLLK